MKRQNKYTLINTNTIKPSGKVSWWVTKRLQDHGKNFQATTINSNITFLCDNRLLWHQLQCSRGAPARSSVSCESAVSARRGETASSFEFVIVSHSTLGSYIPILLPHMQHLSQLQAPVVFNHSQAQLSCLKHADFILEFMFMIRVHIVHLIILADLAVKGRQLSEGHLNVSSVSASLVSRHIHWEGVWEKRDELENEKGVFIDKQWVIHIPSETEAKLSNHRKENKCQQTGAGDSNDMYI